MFLRQKQCFLILQYSHRIELLNTKHFHISSNAFLRKLATSHRSTRNRDESDVEESTYDRNENFYGFESDVGVVHINENSTRRLGRNVRRSRAVSNIPKTTRNVLFGAVRLDSDFKVTSHGQYERDIYSNILEEKLHETEIHHISDDLSNSEVEANDQTSFQGIDPNSICNSYSLIEDQYFENYLGKHKNQQIASHEHHESTTDSDHRSAESHVEKTNKNIDDFGFIDKNYFSPENEQLSSKTHTSHESVISSDQNSIKNSTNEETKENVDDLNFIDENYFSQQNENTFILSPQLQENESKMIEKTKSSDHFHEFTQSTAHSENESDFNIISESQFPSVHKMKQSENKLSNTASKNNSKTLDKDVTFKHQISSEHASELKMKSRQKASKQNEEMENNSVELKKIDNIKDQDNSKTAYDVALNLRKEKIAQNKKQKPNEITRDSKGFRILKNQVPDMNQFTRDEILEMLVKHVLYVDDDIVILNKPYNLVIHDSQTTRDPCLSTFLDDLAKELDRKNSSPKLFTVHRLDKETTGCILLARNELSAQNLKSLFAQRKITKMYWIVTTKVPEPLEGIIDIPIAEGSVDNKARMVLHPIIPEGVKYVNRSKRGKRAVTSYKVIATSGNAALVEAEPTTGIKHQIRVHFGFGLTCPILGDHKYSHLTKMAPQKLQADLLQRLGVRQSKVRYIPLHIHARSIVIPQYLDGRNLFISAPLPPHMRDNLKSLKFKKK